MTAENEGGNGGLAVETLPSLPSLAGLYARGAAASGRIAAGRALPGRTPGPPAGGEQPSLPQVAYRVTDVATDSLSTQLRDYQRLLHEPGSDALPGGYLHVIAFPLATAVMVRGDFPLPLLGMVHLANDVSLLRPVRLGDVLEVQAWAEHLRPHRRGTQVDLVAQVRVTDPAGGEPLLAWHGVSTYLAKGAFLADAPPEPGQDRGGHSEWMPPLPTARWALPGNTGRAYAAISGDRNPIHMSALSAKAFGFRRAIAHGMYTAARALADTGPARGETYRWKVAFSASVHLPGTVDVAITPSAEGHTFVGWSPTRRVRHFEGSVTPL